MGFYKIMFFHGINEEAVLYLEQIKHIAQEFHTSLAVQDCVDRLIRQKSGLVFYDLT